MHSKRNKAATAVLWWGIQAFHNKDEQDEMAEKAQTVKERLDSEKAEWYIAEALEAYLSALRLVGNLNPEILNMLEEFNITNSKRKAFDIV